ncbi:MAG: flippase-like domain-containing protein [Dehalococcoidia bacterium]|nr:flippase-like domain-containing protein [Dehalococcoidia bacterium]MCA9829631.1 flippase-like domain-containing protein [Dehalococcoidia bacterium]MCB9485843.1 flippase-like domain-containing protein [Thermoflexaceae bacterium]
MRRLLVGLLVTAVSLGLLINLVDWRSSISVLERADPFFIGAAVVCLFLSLIAKTVRWRLLLPADANVTTPRLFRILHISFLLNNVLPARLGDVARIAMTAAAPGMRVGLVISSMLTERLTDTVTLLVCFVLVSPFLPVPRAYIDWLHLAWWVLAGLAGAVIAFALLRRHIQRIAARVQMPDGFPGAARVRVEALSFQEGLSQLASRRRVLPIWGASLSAWLTAFAINFMIFQSLDIEVPVTVAVLVTCVTNMAMLVPSSPGYIGVFHAAATLALVPFDVSGSRALSFAIAAHLVNVIPVSILGAVFLLLGRESVTWSWKTRGPVSTEPTAGPGGGK